MTLGGEARISQLGGQVPGVKGAEWMLEGSWVLEGNLEVQEPALLLPDF